jgi:tRNA(Ile)-lysidine synthase
MALCTLLQLHRDKEGWPKDVFSYTVDHRVRPESQQEARVVGEWTTKMGTFTIMHAIELISGFRHRILQLREAWGNVGKHGKLETLLRNARMKVLLEQAEADNVDTILTGHHQDDQYETVLLRLARGSTIIGLGGIPSSRGCFFRPQLDYSKVCHLPTSLFCLF